MRCEVSGLKKKILFVCTGNTCRSAMADGFLKAALEEDEGLNVEYSSASAGISAYDGDCASENAVQALKDGWNINISGHRTSALLGRAIEDAFLVLTMKKDHKEHILYTYPEASQKVFTLKEYSYSLEGNTDISDPFNGSLRIYVLCAHEIKQAVDKLVDKLKKS
jgi:protein-tyrosine phosphatase